MANIKVISKGDFGLHPVSGKYLYKGEENEIDDSTWSGDLFERPYPGWLSPAEIEAQKTEEAAGQPAPDERSE